jgi:hypothetical protein
MRTCLFYRDVTGMLRYFINRITRHSLNAKTEVTIIRFLLAIKRLDRGEKILSEKEFIRTVPYKLRELIKLFTTAKPAFLVTSTSFIRGGKVNKKFIATPAETKRLQKVGVQLVISILKNRNEKTALLKLLSFLRNEREDVIMQVRTLRTEYYKRALEGRPHKHFR